MHDQVGDQPCTEALVSKPVIHDPRFQTPRDLDRSAEGSCRQLNTHTSTREEAIGDPVANSLDPESNLAGTFSTVSGLGQGISTCHTLIRYDFRRRKTSCHTPCSFAGNAT